MDKRQLFTTAHSMTKKAIAKWPTADYKATFATALKLIYKNEKGNDKMTAYKEWNSKTAEEQINALTAMVWHEVKVHKAESDKDGNEKPNYFYWITETADAEQMVNEMFTLMPELLAANDSENGENLPLSLVLHKAAHKATRRIIKAERKHPNGKRVKRDKATDSDTGETITIEQYYYDNMEKADRIAPQPETAAIFRDMIDSATADSIDKRIVNLLAHNIDVTAIAKVIGMNRRNIHRRINKIADRITAYND